MGNTIGIELDNLTEFPVHFDDKVVNVKIPQEADYIMEVQNFPIVIARLGSFNGLAFTEEVLRDALNYYNKLAENDKTTRYILVKHNTSTNPMDTDITPYIAGYIKELRYVKPLEFAGKVWEDGGIVADFYILNTNWGKIIQNLLLKGLPIGVSIRGRQSKDVIQIEAYDPTTEPPTLIIQKCPKYVLMTGFDFVMNPAHVITWFDYKWVRKVIQTSKADELKQLLEKTNIELVKLNRSEFERLAQQVAHIYENECRLGVCNAQLPLKQQHQQNQNGNVSVGGGNSNKGIISNTKNMHTFRNGEIQKQQIDGFGNVDETKIQQQANAQPKAKPKDMVVYEIDGKKAEFSEENPPKIMIVDPEDEVSEKAWGRFSKPQMKRVVSLGGRLKTVKKREVNKIFGLVYKGWEEDWRKLKYPVYELQIVDPAKNEGYNLKAVLNINGLKIATIFILGVDKARTPEERKKVARFLLKYYRQLKKLGYVKTIPSSLKKLAQQSYVIRYEDVKYGNEDDEQFVSELEKQVDNINPNLVRQITILNTILELVSELGGVLPDELEQKIKEVVGGLDIDDIDDEKVDEVINLLDKELFEVGLKQQAGEEVLELKVKPPTSVENVLETIKEKVIEGLNEVLVGSEPQTLTIGDVIENVIGLKQQMGEEPPTDGMGMNNGDADDVNTQPQGEGDEEGQVENPVEIIHQYVVNYGRRIGGILSNSVVEEEDVENVLIGYVLALKDDPQLATELVKDFIRCYYFGKYVAQGKEEVEITPDTIRELISDVYDAIGIWNSGVNVVLTKVGGYSQLQNYKVEYDEDANIVKVEVVNPQPPAPETNEPEPQAEPEPVNEPTDEGNMNTHNPEESEPMTQQAHKGGLLDIEPERLGVIQQQFNAIKEMIEDSFDLTDDDLKQKLEEDDVATIVKEIVDNYTDIYNKYINLYVEHKLTLLRNKYMKDVDNPQLQQLIDEYKEVILSEATTTEEVDQKLEELEQKIAEVIEQQVGDTTQTKQQTKDNQTNVDNKGEPTTDGNDQVGDTTQIQDISTLIDRLIS